MRAAAIVALVVPLAGCLDFDLDFEGQSIGLATNDFQLTITGCADQGLLGCGGTGKMEVVLDGKTHDVPARKPGAFELFASLDFELTVASPMDPDVKLILQGQGVHIEELPWFDLELTKPGVVRRTAGPAHLVFDVFRDENGDAPVTAVLTSLCGGKQTLDSIPAEAIRHGIVEVALDNPALAGDCTHELHVTQTVTVPNSANVSAINARTVEQTFSSTR